jgi:hypothetical protein
MIRVIIIIFYLLNIYIDSSLSLSLKNINHTIKIKHVIVSSIPASLLLSNHVPFQADDEIATDNNPVSTTSSSSKVRRLPVYWNVFERLDLTENAINDIETAINDIQSDIKDINRLAAAREQAMIARLERDKKEAAAKDEAMIARMERDKKDANVRMIVMFGISTANSLLPYSVKTNLEKKS